MTNGGSNLVGNDAELPFLLTAMVSESVSLPYLLTALVSEFGNYGDLYQTHVEEILPRSVFKRVYGAGRSLGLLYSFPFGDLHVDGPGPVPNGKMDAILQRGYLVCGVHIWRGAEFAAATTTNSTTAENEEDMIWSGFHVEFCRGIAAALFADNIQARVVFVEMQSTLDSYAALNNCTVDVVAGARVSLQAQHHEPSTGQSYKFSQPYYYDTEQNNDVFAFMTRMDDVQWSDFVSWIVQASIFAEEEGITSTTSAEIPAVALYGEVLLQMVRDCIFVMGSIGEVWNKTLVEHMPRSGANLFNGGLKGGQLYPIPAV